MLGQTSKLEWKKEGRKKNGGKAASPLQWRESLCSFGQELQTCLQVASHLSSSSRSFWKFSFTLSENPLPRRQALSDALVFKPAAFSLTLTMPLYVSMTRILVYFFLHIRKMKLEEWKSLAQVCMAVEESHEGPGVGWPGRLIRKITAPRAPEIWCGFLRWH